VADAVTITGRKMLKAEVTKVVAPDECDCCEDCELDE
jgi:hypothetical protein